MSNLKVTNIQSKGTGFNDVVSFQNASGTQNGTLCRVWVNFDGTFGTSPFTIANGGIRDAFNVSSITDNGTGDYTVTFSNALADANYSFSVMSATGTAGYVGNHWILNDVGSNITTSSLSLIAGYSQTSGGTGSAADSPAVSVAIFR